MMINTKDMTLAEVKANIARCKQVIADTEHAGEWSKRNACTIAKMELRDLLFAYYNLAPRH